MLNYFFGRKYPIDTYIHFDAIYLIRVQFKVCYFLIIIDYDSKSTEFKYERLFDNIESRDKTKS